MSRCACSAGWGTPSHSSPEPDVAFDTAPPPAATAAPGVSFEVDWQAIAAVLVALLVGKWLEVI